MHSTLLHDLWLVECVDVETWIYRANGKFIRRLSLEEDQCPKPPHCSRVNCTYMHPWCFTAWSLICVRLSVTPWTVAHQAPLSMGFSRQEYWSGCYFLLQTISPTQGLNPPLLCLLHWQVDALLLAPPGRSIYIHGGLVV